MEVFDEESAGWSDMLREACAEAVKHVRKLYFEKGLPIVYQDKYGWLVYEYADGTIKPIQQVFDRSIFRPINIGKVGELKLRFDLDKMGENFD
jgi:hypothetical protein